MVIKIATINLPTPYLSKIKELIDLGLYASRSDFIRKSIEQFLEPELQFYKQLKKEEIG